MIHTHTFTSTCTAYDATQCDERVLTGHALLVPSEGVVGLAWTWPVAVTTVSGELHQMGENPAQVIADAGWSTAQIKHAVDLAVEQGFAITEWASNAAYEVNKPEPE